MYNADSHEHAGFLGVILINLAFKQDNTNTPSYHKIK